MPRMIGQAPPLPEPAIASDIDPERNPLPATVVPREVGGREGLDPTRYGDWEKNGRCIDF